MKNPITHIYSCVYPTPAQKLEKSIAETRLAILEHTQLLEYYKSTVPMLENRLKRLEKLNWTNQENNQS